MKAIHLFFFFLFILSESKSQQYQPMAIEGAHWLMYSLNDGIVNHHFLVIEGDTVLGGLTYKKVYKKDILNNSMAFDDLVAPFFITETSLVGFLRDDTLSQQVFTYPTINEWQYPACTLFSHEMIHDYSLQPLDTLLSCSNEPTNGSATVYAMTTEFLYGKDRRVFSFGSGNVDIEGIGVIDPFWPVHAHFTLESPQHLADYCVGSDADCGIQPTSIIEQQTMEGWNIFPNPFDDLVIIECSHQISSPIEILVMDTMGRLVNGQTIENNFDNRTTIQLPYLARGVYFLSIGNLEFQQVKRIVKK